MTDKIKLKLSRTNGTVTLTGSNATLIKKANQFLESQRIRGLAFYTIRSYGYDLILLFRWLESSKKTFRSLDYTKLMLWVAAQRKAEAAPATINRRLQTCFLFYRFFFNRHIKTAPGSIAPSPYYKGRGYDGLGLRWLPRPSGIQLKVRMPRKIIEVLEPDEIQNFLESFSRYRDLAIVILMLMCGFRSCEILALKVDDINFYDRAIRVRGKGGKERVLPLVDTIRDLLRKYLRYERPRESQADALFLVLQGSKRGSAMTPAGLRNLFRYRRVKTRVEKANPHRFRHCFGTEMARQGVQLPILQKMLGHADSDTTLRYIQLSMTDVMLEYERAIKQIQSRYATIT